MLEPEIIINGRFLDEAQATTVRVALGCFQIDLMDAEFLRRLGPLGEAYCKRASEVMFLLTTSKESADGKKW